MPNGPTNTHFWTTNPDGELLPKPTYHREGVSFYAAGTAGPGLVPVYRFYNQNNNQHFWTVDSNGELLAKPPFHQEGIAFYVPDTDGPLTVPVYRFYDGVDHHFWTVDPNGELLAKPPFRQEGIAFRAYSKPSIGAIPVWRFYSSIRAVGTILQEGGNYKEIVIGPSWQWISTYINLSITAIVGGEPGRPFEIATGFVFPWNDVGPNKQQITGSKQVDLGPVGQLYVRSLDGQPMVFGYREATANVVWKTPDIKF